MPLTPLLPHWQHVANPFSSGPRPRSTKYKSSDGWTDENYVKLMAGQGVEENSIFWTADGLLTFNLEIVVNLKPQGKIKFSTAQDKEWMGKFIWILFNTTVQRTDWAWCGWMPDLLNGKSNIRKIWCAIVKESDKSGGMNPVRYNACLSAQLILWAKPFPCGWSLKCTCPVLAGWVGGWRTFVMIRNCKCHSQFVFGDNLFWEHTHRAFNVLGSRKERLSLNKPQ